MSDLDLIETRRADIARSLRELETQRSGLQAELEELDLAAKVLDRLKAKNADQGQQPDLVRGKPENSPTVPEMILMVLEQAKQDGLRGLEPKQMRSIISERWWPDIRGETVNSIAWRMWKRQQLSKTGAVYMLPL